MYGGTGISHGWFIQNDGSYYIWVPINKGLTVIILVNFVLNYKGFSSGIYAR